MSRQILHGSSDGSRVVSARLARQAEVVAQRQTGQVARIAAALFQLRDDIADEIVHYGKLP